MSNKTPDYELLPGVPLDDCPRCEEPRQIFAWGCTACGAYRSCVDCAQEDHRQHMTKQHAE